MSDKSKLFLQAGANWMVAILLIACIHIWTPSLRYLDSVIAIASVVVSCGIGSAYRKRIREKQARE